MLNRNSSMKVAFAIINILAMKEIIKKTGAILLMCGTVLLLSAQVKAQSQVKKNSIQIKSIKENVATLHLEVDGMHCQRFCANGTDTMLKHKPGILLSKTSFATSSSVVKYDPSLTTPEKIIQAIDERGFKAKIKRGE